MDKNITAHLSEEEILNEGHRMAASGADYVKLIAPYWPVEVLEAGLKYAQEHNGTKTLIQAMKREIRRKGRSL